MLTMSRWLALTVAVAGVLASMLCWSHGWAWGMAACLVFAAGAWILFVEGFPR